MDEQLLGELRKWLELPRVSVINPKQAKQLIGTVKALRAIALGENLNATVKASPTPLPTGNMAVTVEADEIIVHDLKKLCKLLARMRNMEIYSLPNGKVHFAAVFPNVFTVSIIEK